MSEQSFFNKLNQIRVNELVEFLSHNQTEITLKVFDQFIKTNILSIKNNNSFSISRFSDFQFSNEPTICTFQVREERYVFKSYLKSSPTDYIIQVPTELFQLQRRNDFRVSMPIGVYYECEIRSINGSSQNTKAEIRDISLGGCQLSIKGQSSIKENDEIDLYIKLDKFEFSKIPYTAKHIKVIEAQNLTLIGARLYDHSSELLSELHSLLMLLDRVLRGKTND